MRFCQDLLQEYTATETHNNSAMLQPLLLLTAICARPLLAQNTTGVNLTSSLASFANLKWTTYFLDVYDIEDNVSPDSGSVLLAPTDAGWQSFYNSGAGQAIFGDSLNNVTDEDALVNLMSYHFIIDEDFSDAVNGVRGNLSVDNVTSMLPTGLNNDDTGDSLFVTYIQTDATGKYSASFLSAAGMLSNVYSSVHRSRVRTGSRSLLICCSSISMALSMSCTSTKSPTS